MANSWRIAAAGWIITVLGWYLSPIISLLLNKILSNIGFDASRKLRELEIHTIAEMKQVLRDIEEQRMQRKARKERSAVSTLDLLAKDVKSALYQGEDTLDLIDYYQIEKNIIGDGDSEPRCSSWLNWLFQCLSKAIRACVTCCKGSWLGRFLCTTRSALQFLALRLYPTVRCIQATLHRSAVLLPVSRVPAVSFMRRLHCWYKSILTWSTNVIEIACLYRDWSYDVIVGITYYQVDGIAVDSFMPTIARWHLRKRIEELENVVTDARKCPLLKQQSSSGWNDIGKMNRRSITSSTTRKVFGRDRERRMIQSMLREEPDDHAPGTSSSKCYSVICIHGIAGSGKTTLAQYVCDHENENREKYFNPIMLIHVSETFRVNDILHDTLEAITEDRHSDISGCKGLQAKLVDKLSGKRFLLVLDDLWVNDENHQDLEEILSPFNVGKRGSRILVTARNKEAALGANNLISISDLDEEQYFSMFMHYALDSTIFDDRKYIPIGRKIAKKLHRSPIAAVTVAGQLWRNPDISFWETAAKLDLLNKTKGALWWSYQQLDVDVRRCFEYCNIFPRRYELERDTLVHMWIAQGFVKTINAREQEDVEDVGQDYFHDLHSCAFLQLKRKTSSDIDSGEYFTVHDLLHDLAESVAGSDCVRINRGVIGKIPKYVRHLCIESYNEEAFPEQILELRNLSTLIMCYSVKKISQDDFKCVLMRLKKLRVVQLDVQWLGRIPACIGELRHLRYLGISTPPPCNMTLPTEVTKLYHLQVLSVPPNTLLHCSSEEKMSNLINLRKSKACQRPMGFRGGFRPLVTLVLLCLCASRLCSLSHAKRTPRPTPTPAKKPPPSSPSQQSPPPPASYPPLPVRAVCLGGWLVTEGWILPSLFDGIPNKDLLDGTQVQFKSALRKTYLTADQGGGGAVVANRTQASDWETFKLWRMNETTFNFRTSGNQFVGIGASDGLIVATATTPTLPETFQIVRCPFDKNRVRIKAANGYFVQAIATGEVIADYGEPTRWSDFDASVFLMTKVGEQLQGEYQLCNGYGTDKATPLLRDHWSTYIVEDDFKFFASSGLTAVRIPVGWWIASDPNPPAPYVGGSLQALDNAFKWAEKYKLGVIIDLHAAPGSQNPWEHSSSRDGTQEWGTTDANIAQTVQVIDFLASRYATSSSLFAVELMNEPLAPGATLDSLTKYYRDGYDAVRKHSPTAYVVMSNRLSSGNSTELLQFASGLQGAVIDVHYYTVFNRMFNNFTVQQNIDFIRTNFSGELTTVTTHNGPLTFVGEWVAEWKVPNATKEEYQKYATAQMNVYGQATFGWSYWTAKNANNHWDLEWMIKNGYISLKG